MLDTMYVYGRCVLSRDNNKVKILCWVKVP